MSASKDLKIEIKEINESDLNQRAKEVSEWLYGDKKQTFDEILYLLTLYQELYAIQNRELIDLRKSADQKQSSFFPMSTTARKR